MNRHLNYQKYRRGTSIKRISHLVIGRKTVISYGNLILRLLFLDFIEVPGGNSSISNEF
ncbi:hypothetical protein [Leptospira santarosai]|uniref:hypothetical protein n=1 Tax=Leptospira santarosai TaxID=28183 RepID=UPI0018AD1ADF|nr:hypothetical protein [Leptospira santarosai]